MTTRSSSALLLVSFLSVFDFASPFELNSFFGSQTSGNNGNKDLFQFYRAKEDARKREEGRNRIRFALLNRADKTWVEVNRDGTIPKNGIWKPNAPIKMLLHGYTSELHRGAIQVMDHQKILKIAEAYAVKPYNVLLMDWSALAVEPEMHYNFVVGSVPMVGEVLGDFLIALKGKQGIKSLSEMHLVGYGFGAHVAGVAGSHVQNKGVGKFARISGLDPAGVGFDDETGQKAKNKSVSLTRADADFVDVIHCNMGVSRTYQDAKWKGAFGSTVQAGHADFYRKIF